MPVAFIFMTFFLCSSPLYGNAWHYKTFDESMCVEEYPQVFAITKQIFGIPGQVLYGFFKNLYERTNPSLVQQSAQIKIPKIIHQIWLGSEVPDCFKPFMQSWIDHHVANGWEYKLWRDEDIKRIELTNQTLYDATDNYGVKSDIARYEIIYRYGGVYVDLDFECLSPLDIFHYTYDFYTALQPLDTFFVQLGLALFGAKPGHPILRHCIETLHDNWHEKGATKKTGPIHFTKAFYAMADKNKNGDIALPASYFYPLASQEETIDKNAWIKNGAFAVHWWAKSWMPKEYRPHLFREIDNDHSAHSWDE